jgi:hypothetical protein
MSQTEWRKLYLAAISETEPANIRMRIRDAEAAMFSRIESLAEYADLDSERESIANALAALRALQMQRVLSHAPRNSLSLLRKES